MKKLTSLNVAVFAAIAMMGQPLPHMRKTPKSQKAKSEKKISKGEGP